ncbi:hypothetical protein GCM10022408_31910 [Hymenobacter fastidiosus]|uniref:Outer membrane protein beta-barrel domain-containing protein n=1 Tax=Hymenobacter fastidiosus TaxID=486264 RepID=A0ABP7SU55_9BACT
MLSAFSLAAQDLPADAPAYKPYKASFGILANPRVIGVQTEARFLEYFGVRLAATQVFDPHHRQNEFSGGGLGLLTYYVPLKNKRIEPVLGLGGVYSLYHWDTGSDRGNLSDLNVGGGVGVNLRFSSDFRVGFSVLAANGFVADYVEGSMRTVRRKLLVLPALTFDILL